ncbi:DUF6177 family protein [Pseudactinotalea suaedae]|uniref:DUF6177 family protein n=1 Tax=Pseudactinotalea suaedae TaxID=1524924 RepID=UPI0012E109DA|nr:DUF6177 family protein [Pseudactinotalea suaedae]
MASSPDLQQQRSTVVASNPVYAVLAVTGPQVDLLEPVRAFFDECAAEQRRPVLQTEPGATLGPFVVSWLRALSGFWVTRDEAGGVREVQTGAAVTDPIELFELTTAVEEPAEDRFPRSAILLEVVLEHRAETTTTLGGIVPVALTALGAAAPLRWGLHEPLPHRWDVETLTAHARTAMPLTGPIYWRSPDGFGELAAARTQEGLVERVQLTVAHDGAARDALARARDAATALAGTRMPVMTCSVSAIGAHEDLRTRPAAAPPERPLAAMLGPRLLGRLGWSATGVAEQHAGEVVGRARVPGALVTFDEPDLGTARRRYLDLVSA